MLINSKSVIDCNEDEYELHNKEIEEINKKINKLPNYRCIAIIKDITYTEPKEICQLEGNLHNYLEFIEYIDFKNGIDLEIGDCDIFTIIAYGELYKEKSEYGYAQYSIEIIPLDENGDGVDMSKYLVSPIKLFFQSDNSFFN